MENFDNRASTFDDLQWVKDENYLNSVIELLNISGNETVLDVGPGTGPIMRKLLEKYPNLNYVCIEPSERMVEKITDWISSDKKRLDYSITIYDSFDILEKAMHNNYTTSPYIFDAVIMRNVLHHFNSYESIKEALRIITYYTRKMGKIVIGEGCPPFQVYDGCMMYSENKDVELSQKILRMKEDRIDFITVYKAVIDFLTENKISYSTKYIKSPMNDIDNWLDKGSLLSREKKEEIKNIFRDMDENQKKRFGIVEKDNKLYMTFYHQIIYTI